MNPLPSWREQLAEQGIVDGLGLEKYFHVERVQAYYDFLGKHHYFFSKADQTRILERHLYESLIFCFYVADYLKKRHEASSFEQLKLLDAGSGPGLPGFCFTFLRQKLQIFLLDSSRRRLGKLEKWAENTLHLEKTQAHFIYERLEEHKANYDCITARALAPLPLMLRLCSPLQKKGSVLALAVSRIHISTKIANFLEQTGYVSRETIFPKELQFLGLRQILVLEKTINGTSKRAC